MIQSKELASCIPPIDLIVCDEGHRLKSKDNKTTKMFDMLKTQRRISKSYYALLKKILLNSLKSYQARPYKTT